MKTEVSISHPRKTIVTEFPAGGRRTRKYDGCFTTLEIAGCTVLAEYVTAKSGAFLTLDDKQLLAAHGHFYAAFDVVTSYDGQSCENWSTRARLALLDRVLSRTPPHPILLPRGGEGTVNAPVILAEHVVESAASVIARGGEGVCWQDWSAPFGEMLVIKVASSYLCRVGARAGGQSVEIERILGGDNLSMDQARAFLAINHQPAFSALRLGKLSTINAGKVALRGGKCDQVHPGSIIRVEGMGLTEAGKIRQPVLCREWVIA